MGFYYHHMEDSIFIPAVHMPAVEQALRERNQKIIANGYSSEIDAQSDKSVLVQVVYENQWRVAFDDSGNVTSLYFDEIKGGIRDTAWEGHKKRAQSCEFFTRSHSLSRIAVIFKPSMNCKKYKRNVAWFFRTIQHKFVRSHTITGGRNWRPLDNVITLVYTPFDNVITLSKGV